MYVLEYSINEIKNILAGKTSQICNLGIPYAVLTAIHTLLDYQTPKDPLPKGTHKCFDNYCCPSCKRPLPTEYEDYQIPYCQGCGQKINWNNKDRVEIKI